MEPIVNLKLDAPSSTVMRDASRSLELAHAFMFIDSADTYQLAGEELQRVMGLSKRLDEEESAIIDPINKAHAAVKDHFRGPRQYLEQAVELLKNGMLFYLREEDRKRVSAQRVLDEAAARERERLAKEALGLRQQAESEAIRLRMEANNALTPLAASRLEAEAEALAEIASITARGLEEAAQMMIAPTAAQTVPKVSGISSRKHWNYEIIDKELIPREYWIIDEKKLSKVVRSLCEATNIPGIRAFPENTIASRSK